MVVVLVFMTPEAPAHPGQRKKTLAEKVGQLMDWTQKNRVIRMNDAMFNRFVLEKPRNYSVIVMFTTLQKFRLCVTCKLALQEFQILADSWQFSSAFSNKVFFAMVDFDESPEVSEMLQVMSVPNVLHFSAKSKFTADDIYNFKERGIIAQQMFTWVAERNERRMVNVRTRKPINYYYSFKLGISLAFIGGLVYVLKWNRKFSFNKNLWAVLAVFCDFDVIWSNVDSYTRSPVCSKQYTGQTHYIHEVHYFQFVAEMYIISLFHVCITLEILLLDTAATSPMIIINRKIMSMTCLCLVVIFFSWLLSLFRFKEHNYPFHILVD